MIRLDLDNCQRWRVATKTKSIRAKPLISIMVDRSVLSKFLIDTLEGKEPLGDGTVICIGEFNDAWQQTPKKLLQKYDVTSIDNDGWMVCDPKPDNEVECHEIGPWELEPPIYPSAKHALLNPLESSSWKDKPFYVVGLWGETLPNGTKNVQRGVAGDFVCRSCTDPTDIWVVQRKIFLNTYAIKE